MLVGVIGAMKVEVAELVKCMNIDSIETISSIKYYNGTINGFNVVIAKCGPGKVNAAICTQTMIMKYSPDVIINTGVAGSLTSLLEIGDCAIGSSVVQYDVDTTAVGDPIGLISGVNMVEFPCDASVAEKLVQSLDCLTDTKYQIGLIATGDKFLKSNDDKNKILKYFNAIACEMESGSIGQVCYINKIPFGIIRSISDNADHASCMDYEQFLELAAMNASNVVKNFLEKINHNG